MAFFGKLILRCGASIRCAVAYLTIALGTLGICSQTVIAQQWNVTGRWDTMPYTMPINPIHVGLMHTGRVLIVVYRPDRSFTPVRIHRLQVQNIIGKSWESVKWFG